MQRAFHRCPRCAEPLGISRDMWGQYYLCASCGFTAEDDDDLNVVSRATAPPSPAVAQLAEMETYRLRQTALNR